MTPTSRNGGPKKPPTSGRHALAPSIKALTGTVLHDRFRLDKPIARGGMSVLFKATQIQLGRTVAVKLMVLPEAADDAVLEKRFLREARAVAALKHPNTVTVHDYGRTPDGTYFMVMEYLDGRNLSRTIREQGPLPPGRAIPIALQICGSLDEAHQLGLVHRDLKPSNVFLSSLGGNPDHITVLDFGLVKINKKSADENDAWETRSGILIGTPAYMAPEQIVDEDVDARTDVYSFGALMFHVLAGRPPFEDPSEFRVLQQHVKEPPPRLSSVYPDCLASEDLERVVRRCLAKAPERRYPSMADVAEALLACEQDSASMSRDSGWVVRPASGSYSIPVPRPSASPSPQQPSAGDATAAAGAAAPNPARARRAQRAPEQPAQPAFATDTPAAPDAAQPAQAAFAASAPESPQPAPVQPAPAQPGFAASAPVAPTQPAPAQTTFTAPALDYHDPNLDQLDLSSASRRWGARVGMLFVLAVIAGLIFGVYRMVKLSSSARARPPGELAPPTAPASAKEAPEPAPTAAPK